MLTWDYVYDDVKFVDEYLTRAQEDVVKCRAKVHNLAEQLMQKKRALGPNDQGIMINVKTVSCSHSSLPMSGGLYNDPYKSAPFSINPSSGYSNFKYTPITPIMQNYTPNSVNATSNITIPNSKFNFDINKYQIDDKGISGRMNNVISAQNNLTNLIGDISNTYTPKSATLEKCTSQTRDLQNKLIEVEKAIDKLTRELQDIKPSQLNANFSNEIDYPVLDSNNHNDWYSDYSSIDPLINNFNKLREQLQKVQNAVQMSDNSASYIPSINPYNLIREPTPMPYLPPENKFTNLSDSVRTLTQQAESALQASYQVISKMKCRENPSFSRNDNPAQITLKSFDYHPSKLSKKEERVSNITARSFQPGTNLRPTSNTPICNYNNYVSGKNSQLEKNSQNDRPQSDRPEYMPSQYLSEMPSFYSRNSKDSVSNTRVNFEKTMRASKTDLIRKRLNQTLRQISNPTPSFLANGVNESNSRNHNVRKTISERDSITEKKKSAASDYSSKIQASAGIKESDSSSQSSEELNPQGNSQPEPEATNSDLLTENSNMIQTLLKQARMYSLNDNKQPGPSYLPVVPIFFVENKIPDLSNQQISGNNSVQPNRDPDRGTMREQTKINQKLKNKKATQK